MGRRASWLVVATVAAVGLAAAVDALRGDGEPPWPRPAAEPGTTTTAGPPSVPAQDLSPGVDFTGVLYYTDAGCRLRALQLPGLGRAAAPAWTGCHFSLSPDGRRVEAAGTHWRANGEVFPDAPRRPAASVTPSGRLTFVRGADLVDARNGAVLVSESSFRRALHVDPNIPEDDRLVPRFHVVEAAWLSETRVVTTLTADVVHGPHEELLAIFEGRRPIHVRWASARGLSDLRVSPHGSFLAARATNRGGFLLLDRDGNSVPAPPVTGYRAIAWAPDESWAVIATRASLYVFHTGTGELRLRRLPIEAHDLAWRSGAPALGDTASLSRWLGRAGVGGKLYLSDAGCRIRALRVPALEWANPRGVEGPCRFSISGSGGVADERVAWQPQGRMAAVCQGGILEVYTADEERAWQTDGCAPTWKPGGSLTFIRNGDLVLSSRLRHERIVLSAARVKAALGREASLEEVAWLDGRQLAAAVRRGRLATLAVFYGGRLVHRPGFSALRIEHLRAGRGMIAALTSGPGGASVTFFDLAGGKTLALRGHAFAWSPGGSITAVADRGRILFVEPTTAEFRNMQLHATDMEWR